MGPRGASHGSLVRCLLFGTMLSFSKVAGLVLSFALSAAATPIIYDGRAPFNLTDADLDSSTGPYLTYALFCFS